MKYGGSFFDLINSLENVLGGCVFGGIIRTFQIGIVPKSLEFASWMTTPDPEVDIEDDCYTPDFITMSMNAEGGADPELGMVNINDVDLIPYFLHEGNLEFCVICAGDGSKSAREQAERKFGWHDMEENVVRARSITERLLPAMEQYLEDLERYKNGEITRKNIRNYACGESSFVVYARIVSASEAIMSRGERPEADIFIRVVHDHPYAHEAAWLAYAIVENFADKSGCMMQTMRPEDQGGY